jgi:hypothetical protein
MSIVRRLPWLGQLLCRAYSTGQCRETFEESKQERFKKGAARVISDKGIKSAYPKGLGFELIARTS